MLKIKTKNHWKSPLDTRVPCGVSPSFPNKIWAGLILSKASCKEGLSLLIPLQGSSNTKATIRRVFKIGVVFMRPKVIVFAAIQKRSLIRRVYQIDNIWIVRLEIFICSVVDNTMKNKTIWPVRETIICMLISLLFSPRSSNFSNNEYLLYKQHDPECWPKQTWLCLQ